MDWIAATCGFGTPASLRAHFARIVGIPPTAYRRTFHDPSRPSRIASWRTPSISEHRKQPSLAGVRAARRLHPSPPSPARLIKEQWLWVKIV